MFLIKLLNHYFDRFCIGKYFCFYQKKNFVVFVKNSILRKNCKICVVWNVYTVCYDMVSNFEICSIFNCFIYLDIGINSIIRGEKTFDKCWKWYLAYVRTFTLYGSQHFRNIFNILQYLFFCGVVSVRSFFGFLLEYEISNFLHSKKDVKDYIFNGFCSSDTCFNFSIGNSV